METATTSPVDPLLDPQRIDVDEATPREVVIDLWERAQDAHIERLGALVAPGAPGWLRALAREENWSPPVEEGGHILSWLYSSGGTLSFPVPERDADQPPLQELLLWLHTKRRGQVVSLFLDEQPLKTISLSPRGRLYRLPLSAPVQSGEHRLRFWFRHLWPHEGRRSPAGIGPVLLVPRGQRVPIPRRWRGVENDGQRKSSALYAGAPAAWRFYTLIPPEASFESTLSVNRGSTLRFSLSLLPAAEKGMAEQENAVEVELFSRQVRPGERVPISIPLNQFATRPVQLKLKSEAVDSAHRRERAEHAQLEDAAWLVPKILQRHEERGEFKPLRNIVVWIFDELPQGDFDHQTTLRELPNLAMLRERSWPLSRVWTGSLSKDQGHQRLLAPAGVMMSLPQLAREAGYQSALISTRSQLRALADDFGSVEQVLEGEGEAFRHALDSSLKELHRGPFLLYISTPLGLFKQPPLGFKRLQERREIRGMRVRSHRALTPSQRAALNHQDFWLAYLISRLEDYQISSETGLIISGASGSRERGGALSTLSRLEVPALFYHPSQRPPTRLTSLQGGDLSDLGATIIQLLQLSDDPWLPGRRLTPGLFTLGELPLRSLSASQGSRRWTRLHRWLLDESPHRPPALWDLQTSAEHPLDPITFRGLRDGLLRPIHDRTKGLMR
ncbi:MAG: hypothetical protein VYD19_04835 [Myxococcota bacterium]|nr:hypothetical protein [Myxococcota bacterium]